MKTLKLIIVCLALFAGQKLFAQGNLIVNNNSPLDNGLVSFGFFPGSGCDYTQPFSANTTGYSSAYTCLPSAFSHARITFDDPTCSSNPQGPIILTPGNPVFVYLDCTTTTSYTLQLSWNGSGDYIVDIF